MKKSQLTLITLAFTACFLGNCKASSTKSQSINDTDSLKTAEAQAAQEADTLAVKKDSCNLQEGKNLDVIIRVDYPTRTDDLASNVRETLNQKLADAYLATVNEDTIEIESYQGISPSHLRIAVGTVAKFYLVRILWIHVGNQVDGVRLHVTP